MLNSCIRVRDNDIISYTFAFSIQFEGMWPHRRSGHRRTKYYRGTHIGNYSFIWGISLAAKRAIERSSAFEPLAPDIGLPFPCLRPLLDQLGWPQIARIVLTNGLDAITPELGLRLFNNLVILRRNLGNAIYYTV